MSGVTRCSGTPLPLPSFAEVLIKMRKMRKKGEKKNEKWEKGPSACGTPGQQAELFWVHRCVWKPQLINKWNYSGWYGNLSEYTFAFKSCIESIFGIEVPWDNRHQPHTLLLW